LSYDAAVVPTSLIATRKAGADRTPDTSSGGDGRVARGIRARESIAESLIRLLEDGVEHPTARQVADRAGVSLRLVFHHFEDMESVLRSAVAIQVDRHWRKLVAIGTDGDLEARIRRSVNQIARLYEEIAPVRRAAGLAAGGSPTLAKQLESARVMIRSQLQHTFSGELAGSGARETLDALEVSTSFDTWDHLRRQTRRSAPAARKVVEQMMSSMLRERN
jgi:AcrR family transcriptional regulator